MSNNYEMNRHLVQQKLQARYQETSQHRLSRQVETAGHSSGLASLNRLTFVLAGVAMLVILLLGNCAGPQLTDQSLQEPDSESLAAQALEPTAVPAPTAEPSLTPEMEPEKMDLGHDAWLLVRGLPEDVTLDTAVDPTFKDQIPNSRNFDYVGSEIAIVTLTQHNEPAAINNGIVELCFKGALSPGTNEKPVPYYWDTGQTPLVDGRPLRASTTEKDPELVVCMMVEKSGAYGLVNR